MLDFAWDNCVRRYKIQGSARVTISRVYAEYLIEYQVDRSIVFFFFFLGFFKGRNRLFQRKFMLMNKFARNEPVDEGNS